MYIGLVWSSPRQPADNVKKLQTNKNQGNTKIKIGKKDVAIVRKEWCSKILFFWAPNNIHVYI